MEPALAREKARPRVSKSAPQNLKNHARLDPAFHFFLFFIVLANLIVSIVYLIQHPRFYSAWLVVLSVAVFVFLFKLRLYPLKVQDRSSGWKNGCVSRPWLRRSGARKLTGSARTS